jgi:hypothetical protein
MTTHKKTKKEEKENTHTVTHTQSHTHSHTHTHLHTLTYTHTHSHTLTYTHPHIYTPCPKLKRQKPSSFFRFKSHTPTLKNTEKETDRQKDRLTESSHDSLSIFFPSPFPLNVVLASFQLEDPRRDSKKEKR